MKDRKIRKKQKNPAIGLNGPITGLIILLYQIFTCLFCCDSFVGIQVF